MGYRMSLGCTCEEGHYSLELDESFARTVWQDDFGLLKQLGLASISSLGVADDEDEEAENVEIDPEVFAQWLEAVEARREEILEALRSRGGHPATWRAWQEREFAEDWRSYRELAQHAAAEGVAIDAGWA